VSTPSASHPFRQEARRAAIAYRRGWRPRSTFKRHGEWRCTFKRHGEWRCTHLLVYEDLEVARMYFWRGAYYTAEQYAHGEPGLTRRDLREGETIEPAYGNREDDE
jgi:hypothetical protein